MEEKQDTIKFIKADSESDEMTKTAIEQLTDWKNEPSWSDLNNDRTEGLTSQEMVRNNLKKWEEYRDGGKPVKARPGKSKVRPKLIRKQAEWKYPALEEPFLNTTDMFEIKPRTAEDIDAARQNGLILNYQWSTKINKTKLVNDIVRTIVDEGTVIVKSGWDAEYGIKVVEEEEPEYASPEESISLIQQAVQSGEMSEEEAMAMMELGQPMQTGTKKVYVEKETLIRNHPTYEVVHNANIMIDPTCEGVLENAQFIIHEYPTSMAELKKDEYERIEEEIQTTQDDGTIVTEKRVSESGIYKNLDAITDGEGEFIYDEWDSESANTFKYNDDTRKKLRAFDYWGYWDIDGNGTVEPIIATWIGNIMIRMEKNPFPHGELPFSLATYMPIKKETFGEPDAELLIDNQESIGKLTRAMHDITANQAVGQEFIDEQFFPSPVQRDNYTKGNTVFFRHGMDPKTSIYKNNIDPIPNTVPAFIAAQEADAESLTGTKAFTGGISGNALGDMLDINTDIPLINGKFKKMGDIEVGDELIGLNGKGTKVKELFDIAYPERAFDLTFGNGAVIKAGVEHKWTIKVQGIERKYRDWHTVDTARLEELMELAKTKPSLKIYIPRVKRVDMNGEIPDIDAYTTGAWLGDGGSWHPSITSEDKGILDNIRKVYDLVEASSQTEGSKAKTYYIVSKDKDSKNERDEKGQFTEDENSFENKLIKYGLHKRYGGEKHIPEAFFSAPYETKMELIRGLMDTDGYAHSGAFNIFCQAEGRLKDDFIRLIKSIGVTPKISKRLTADEVNKRKAKYKSGLDVVARKTMYEIGFTCEDNPFSLKRKADKWKAPKQTNTYRLTSIVEVDKVLMRCLAVDSEDHLFAAGDTMIMTHNSVGGIRSALDATSKRELSILRRLSDLLFKDLARKTIAMNQAYLQDEEIIRITNDFVVIRRDDLAGEFDLKVDVSTPEKDNETAEKLNMMLQTNAASMDQEEARIIRSKIARLWKLPDLAEHIENFKPSPDPVAEQIKQIELENAMLKNEQLKKLIEESDSKIHERISRVIENEKDVENKDSQRRLREAQIRKLESESDTIDQAFVDKQTGASRQRELEDKKIDSELKKENEILMARIRELERRSGGNL